MKTFKPIRGFLSRQKKRILFLTILIITIIILAIILQTWLERNGNRTLQSLGILRTTGVRVYGGDLIPCDGDENCLNWSIIYPGMSINRSFYVQSKSNINATLKVEYGDWVFKDSNNQIITNNQTVNDLSTNMTLTCPQHGIIIHPNEVIYVTLTLSPKSSPEFIENIIVNDVQTFDFDTHIYIQE